MNTQAHDTHDRWRHLQGRWALGLLSLGAFAMLLRHHRRHRRHEHRASMLFGHRLSRPNPGRQPNPTEER